MIKTYQYSSSGWRPDPSTLGKCIDIGGANSFAHGHLDAIIDIRHPQASAENIFVGNIDMLDLWVKVRDYVFKFGPWDYAICTHTLEDILNPMLVCGWIQHIAKAGLIVTPSKFREFARFQGQFRGFMHHHWIFDVINDQFTAFPKLNFIEHQRFNQIPGPEKGGEELIIEWEGEIDLKMINDGMPYGTDKLSGEQHMQELYNQLLP